MRRRKPDVWLPVTAVTNDIAQLSDYLFATGPMLARDAACWLAGSERIGGRGGAAERINTLVRRGFLERVDWAPPVADSRQPSLSVMKLVGPGAASIMHFRRQLGWEWSGWSICCSVPVSRLLLRMRDVSWQASGGDRRQGVIGRLRIGERSAWVAVLRYPRSNRVDVYKEKVVAALRHLPAGERLWLIVPDEAFFEQVTAICLDAAVLDRTLVTTDFDVWMDRTIPLPDVFRAWGDNGWERVRIAALEEAERVQSAAEEEGTG